MDPLPHNEQLNLSNTCVFFYLFAYHQTSCVIGFESCRFLQYNKTIKSLRFIVQTGVLCQYFLLSSLLSIYMHMIC